MRRFWRFAAAAVVLGGCTVTKSAELPPEIFASKLDGMTHQASSLVHETRSLATSATALRSIDRTLDRASSDLARAGRQIVDHAAGRAAELAAWIAGLVVAIRIGSFLVKRIVRRPPGPPRAQAEAGRNAAGKDL